jgi:hypothetical protein
MSSVAQMTEVCPKCGAELTNVEARLKTRTRPEDAGVSDYFHLATLCTNRSCPGRHQALSEVLAGKSEVKRLSGAAR